MADITVEEAVIRNCEALIAGNIVQIFADMSPQAMVKLSQSMASPMSGGGTPPKLTGYEIADRSQDGDRHVYDVRFSGDVNFGVKAYWEEVDNAWKLVDFEPYQM